RQIAWKERDHALFVAFAPVGAPRYVCATVVEHGGVSGGGGPAGAPPIFRGGLLAAPRPDPPRPAPHRYPAAPSPKPRACAPWRLSATASRDASRRFPKS